MQHVSVRVEEQFRQAVNVLEFDKLYSCFRFVWQVACHRER